MKLQCFGICDFFFKIHYKTIYGIIHDMKQLQKSVDMCKAQK